MLPLPSCCRLVWHYHAMKTRISASGYVRHRDQYQNRTNRNDDDAIRSA